ncbi:unnamed protein product [Cyprideis torosa]|uniref:Uncharacterized protein n=1 Tax=Cyprideis torosa TaxID=163714 RepID=A0A7R8W1Q5_9CRUS|nr:unnamed protein product [Cyprideis torosa]CAG0879042.1 unnamed protein product [Cyprideis torosa]
MSSEEFLIETEEMVEEEDLLGKLGFSIKDGRGRLLVSEEKFRQELRKMSGDKIDELMKCVKTLSDKGSLSALSRNCVLPEDEEECPPLLRMMLETRGPIHSRTFDFTVEALVEASYSEEQVSNALCLILLLRHLHVHGDPMPFAQRLIMLLQSAATGLVRDLLRVLPEIVPITVHPHLLPVIEEIFENQSNLRTAVLSAAEVLKVPAKSLEKLNNSVIDLLPSLEMEDVPVFARYLMNQAQTEADLPLLDALREKIDFSPWCRLPPVTQPDSSEEVLCEDSNEDSENVLLFLRMVQESDSFTNPRLSSLLLTAIDRVPTAAGHRSIDLLLLLSLYNKAAAEAVFNLLSRKMKSGQMGELLFRMAFKEHPRTLRHLSQPLCNLCYGFLASTCPKTGRAACLLLSLVFHNAPDEIRHGIAMRLASVTAEGVSRTTERALLVLANVLDREPDLLVPFSSVIAGTLESVPSLPLSQMRLLLDILSALAARNRGGTEENILRLFVIKNLCHSLPRFKKMGLVAFVMTLKNGMHRSIADFKASWETARKSVARCSSAAGLLYDLISDALVQQAFPQPIAKALSTIVLEEFQSTFLVDVDATNSSLVSDGRDEGAMVALNLKVPQPEILCPLFRLLVCCQGSTDSLDQLILCPVLRSETVGTSFLVVSWHRELLNAFARDESQRPKLLQRLRDVITAEKRIEDQLNEIQGEFLPPQVFFDVESQKSIAQQAGRKKPRRFEQINLNLREMSLDVSHLLQMPFDVKGVQEDAMWPSEVNYLLLDLSQKADFLLGEKRVMTGNPQFRILSLFRDEDFVEKCVAVTPSVAKILVTCCEEASRLVTDIDDDGDPLEREIPIPLTRAAHSALSVFKNLVKWRGFSLPGNKELLLSFLKALISALFGGSGSRRSSQWSADVQAQIKRASKGLRNLYVEGGIKDLEFATLLTSLLSTLGGLKRNANNHELIQEICTKALSSSCWNADVPAPKELVAALVQTSPDPFVKIRELFECLEKVLRTEDDSEQEDLSQGIKVPKNHADAVYKCLLSEMIRLNRCEVALTVPECHTRAELLELAIGLLRRPKVPRGFLGGALKHARTILELFVRDLMPILDKTFKDNSEAVLAVVGSMQKGCRSLHFACNQVKVGTPGLVALVPPLRLMLEKFVIRVGGLLASNGCQVAFWVGALKRKNLAGQVIPDDNEDDDDDVSAVLNFNGAAGGEGDDPEVDDDAGSTGSLTPGASTTAVVLANHASSPGAMAGPGSIVVTFEELENPDSQWNPLLCVLCRNLMVEPCLLSCYHIFCSRCLSGRVAGGKVTCPFCAKVTLLRESTGPLPSDPILHFLVEAANQERPNCANCEKKCADQPMFFCQTCGQALCQTCRDDTHRARMFANHDVVPLTRQVQDVYSKCQAHGEPYITFSSTRKKMFCISCLREIHGDNRLQCVDLEIAYQQGAQKLEKALTGLEDVQASVREGLTTLRAKMDELRANVDAEKAAILQFQDTLERIIKETKNRLFQELESQLEKRDRGIRGHLSTLGSIYLMIRIQLSLGHAFLQAASQTEFLSLGYSLLDRIAAVAHLNYPLNPQVGTSIRATGFQGEFSRALEPLFPPSMGAQGFANFHSEPVDEFGRPRRPSLGRIKAKCMETQGPFADHCRAFDSMMKDTVVRFDMIKEQIGHLHKEMLNLKNSGSQGLMQYVQQKNAGRQHLDEILAEASRLERDMGSSREKVEQLRNIFARSWDETVSRVHAERALFDAQILELNSIQMENSRIRQILIQLEPYLTDGVPFSQPQEIQGTVVGTASVVPLANQGQSGGTAGKNHPKMETIEDCMRAMMEEISEDNTERRPPSRSVPRASAHTPIAYDTPVPMGWRYPTAVDQPRGGQPGRSLTPFELEFLDGKANAGDPKKGFLMQLLEKVRCADDASSGGSSRPFSSRGGLSGAAPTLNKPKRDRSLGARRFAKSDGEYEDVGGTSDGCEQCEANRRAALLAMAVKKGADFPSAVPPPCCSSAETSFHRGSGHVVSFPQPTPPPPATASQHRFSFPPSSQGFAHAQSAFAAVTPRGFSTLPSTSQQALPKNTSGNNSQSSRQFPGYSTVQKKSSRPRAPAPPVPNPPSGSLSFDATSPFYETVRRGGDQGIPWGLAGGCPLPGVDPTTRQQSQFRSVEKKKKKPPVPRRGSSKASADGGSGDLSGGDGRSPHTDSECMFDSVRPSSAGASFRGGSGNGLRDYDSDHEGFLRRAPAGGSPLMVEELDNGHLTPSPPMGTSRTHRALVHPAPPSVASLSSGALSEGETTTTTTSGGSASTVVVKRNTSCEELLLASSSPPPPPPLVPGREDVDKRGSLEGHEGALEQMLRQPQKD